MPAIVVIADAGPLIALARAGALHILPGLFREVSVTPEVRGEVLTGSGMPGEDEIEAAIAAGWIRIRAPGELPGAPKAISGLGPGEASSIALAVAIDASLLVIDDRLGRIEAKGQGVEIIGTAALVALAKTEGLIPSARTLLAAIVANGYFIGSPVIDAVCDRAGE